jgi:hypothetical protein
MEKFGSGIEKIRIRDKHPGSATLVADLDPNLDAGRQNKPPTKNRKNENFEV